MDFDETQVLTLSEVSYNSDEDKNSDQEQKLVAHLKVKRQKDLPETLYPVYEGETLIGRDPHRCKIHIPVKALSKVHACILVSGENHMIYDMNSRNKTRKGKVFLKPDVRYNLEDGDCITFADIKCSYMYMKTQCDDDDDDATDSNLGVSPLKLPNSNDKPTQDESVHYELDEDELSSDILQPTQADALPSTMYCQSQATQLYVAESDEDKTATSTDATDYIPDSDGEIEPKKDSNHVIQDATLHYDLLTEEKRDNDNNEVSTNVMASQSSGEDSCAINQNEIAEKNKADITTGTSTVCAKDSGTAKDAEACDLDLDATQTAGVDPEDYQPAVVDVPECQSQMATQTYGHAINVNEIFKKNETGIDPGTHTACATDHVTVMDNEAYELDLNATQSASLDPEENQAAQVDVVPDSQSQIATQTFVADEGKEDDMATQTFKNHSVGEHRPVVNTKCSTMAFNYNSDDDDDDEISAVFQSHQIANKDDMSGTTVSSSEVTYATKNDADETQVITEEGVPNCPDKADATQTLEEDKSQSTEQPDHTQIMEQPDETQILADCDAVTQILTGDAPKKSETSVETQIVKDDKLIKLTETTDSTQLLTQGDDDTVHNKSSVTQILTEVNGNNISEKSISLQLLNKSDPVKISENSVTTQMVTKDNRCNKSDEEATQLVQQQDSLEHEDTSELYIAETQPSEHSDTSIDESQGSICHKESLVVAETPIHVVHHIGVEESTQNLHVITDKEEVKSEDITARDSIPEDMTHVPDETQLTEVDKGHAPTQGLTSQLPDPVSVDATLLLDSTCDDAHPHPPQPELISYDNTSSSDMMESKSLSPAALARTSTSLESSATSNSNNEQPADKQLLTLRSDGETENSNSSKDVNNSLANQESLCQDKLPGSTSDIQADVPAINNEAVASTQPFGDENADDMMTQPYCSDVLVSEQLSPCSTDKQEMQSIRTYPRRKQPNRTKTRKSGRVRSMHEASPVESHDYLGVTNRESAVSEVKSVRMTRRRGKAKVASVNLSQEQKSGMAQKKGNPSTKLKLNEEDVASEKSGSRKQRTMAKGRAKEQEKDTAEAQLQPEEVDKEKQQQPAENEDTAHVLMEGEPVSQERKQNMTDNNRTALVNEEYEQMASTQAYCDELGDVLETQPYDYHPVSIQLSSTVGESPEIEKSSPKRNQQSVGRKKKRQTKTKTAVKKISGLAGDDDNQKGNDCRKAGTHSNDVKQNEDSLQRRITRSARVNLEFESSQQKKTVVEQGRRSRCSDKLVQETLLVTTKLTIKEPVKVFEDAVVLLERLNTEKYGSPVKMPTSADSCKVNMEDKQIASTQAYGIDNDHIANTQPYSEQPATEELSLDDVKTRELVKLRKSNRNQPSALRKSDRQLKRESVEQRILNAEHVQKEKGRNSEDKKGSQTRKSQAEFDTENRHQGETGPSLPKEAVAVLKTRKGSARKIQGKKDKNDVKLKPILPVTATHIKQEIFEDAVVLLERVDSSDSSFGEHSFHTPETMSHQKCLENRRKKYSRLRLKKGNVGQTKIETCTDGVNKSHSAGNGIHTQLKEVKQELGHNITSALMTKTKERSLGMKSQLDNFVADDLETDHMSPKVKKEGDTSEQYSTNIKTESVTEIGNIYPVFEKTSPRRKRSVRRRGKSAVQTATLDIQEMSSNSMKYDEHLIRAHDCNTSKHNQFDTRLGSNNENDEFEPGKKKKGQGLKRGASNKTDITETISHSKKLHLALDKNHVEDVKETPSEMTGESLSEKSSKQKRKSKQSKQVENKYETEHQTIGKRPKMTPKTSTPKQKMSHDSVTVCSPMLRKRTLESKPKVLFTGNIENRAKKIVTSLGGALVTSIEESTHLVTDKVRRTVKFLCAVAKGLPVVSPLWLDSCKTAGLFLDASHFLVNDKDSEKLYKFNLASSLKAASEHTMLDGYKIYVTPSVMPPVKEMKEIITCAGGELLAKMPTIADANTIIVSCAKDQAKCKTARSRGVAIVTAEFLLTGILQQVVDIDAYRL